MGSNGNVVRMEGKRFGNLTVLRSAGSVRRGRNANKIMAWVCSCTCGQTVVVRGDHLRQNRKKSCCLDRHFYKDPAVAAVRPEFVIWNGMIQRCYNPNVGPAWKRYGGRGIKVHRKWKNSFQQFLSDMGPRPSPLHSIDRFPDRDGDYAPGNVRWATAREQNLNRDVTVRVVFRDQEITVSEYARMAGVNARMIQKRLKRGWTVEEALLIPKGGGWRREFPPEWFEHPDLKVTSK